MLTPSIPSVISEIPRLGLAGRPPHVRSICKAKFIPTPQSSQNPIAKSGSSCLSSQPISARPTNLIWNIKEMIVNTLISRVRAPAHSSILSILSSESNSQSKARFAASTRAFAAASARSCNRPGDSQYHSWVKLSWRILRIFSAQIFSVSY